jgi:hypothetical protein
VFPISPKEKQAVTAELFIPGRTIVIAAYFGFALRYFLRTGLVERLFALEPILRLVFLVLPEDEERLRVEFGSSRMVFRAIDAMTMRRLAARRGGGLLLQIRQCVLDTRLHHASADYWLGNFLHRYVNLGPLHRVSQYYFRGLVWLLRRSSLLRRLERRLEGFLVRSAVLEPLMREFAPALLVTPSAGFFQVDVQLLREARRIGLPSMGIVTNWDHTTSKGTSGQLPNRVLAWGEVMREELEIHHDVPPENIDIVGPLHYDHYFETSCFVDRVTFCSHYSLDSSRKIVLYAGMSPRPYPWNPQVVEMLARGCTEGRYGVDAQLLVRLHPSHLQGETDWPEQWRRETDAYADITARYPHVVIETPVGQGGKGSFDLSSNDSGTLANLLHHADVVVCYFSTLNLEAAILDRPVVNCNIFKMQRGAHTDQRSVFSLSHLQGLLDTGSSRIADTEAELDEAVAAYLTNPTLDAPERRAMWQHLLGNHGGGAVNRAAHAILEQLNPSISTAKNSDR